MNNNVIFLLDNDKDFLELYSKLLKNKGCQVFATDNLFLMIKYAQTALPEWIFIDESFISNHENDIIRIINKKLPQNSTNYAIMSQQRFHKHSNSPEIEFIYKPEVLEKIIKISESSCNIN